jgi:hypothetical protein
MKALLLLENAPAHRRIDLLRSKDGKIKCLFLHPYFFSLIWPMDQGVILTCKLLYRHKQLDECYVCFKDAKEGNFEDNIGTDSREQNNTNETERIQHEKLDLQLDQQL